MALVFRPGGKKKPQGRLDTVLPTQASSSPLRPRSHSAVHPRGGGGGGGRGGRESMIVSGTARAGEQLVQVVSFLPLRGFQGWNRGDELSSNHTHSLPALPSLTLATFSSIILPSKMCMSGMNETIQTTLRTGSLCSTQLSADSSTPFTRDQNCQ